MKQIAIYISAFTFLFSCSNRTDNKDVKTLASLQSEFAENIDTIPEAALWADEYIIKYLEGNKDRLTDIDGHPLTYIKDITKRNKKKYAAIKIGHSFENRFVTNQWIYVDSLTKEIYEFDLANDSLIPWEEIEIIDNESNAILPNGKYHFDFAFAEWGGKSLGEKVTILINNKSIKVIYEGDGKIALAKKGEVLDQGIIMKHKSGVWIIGKNPSDTQLDEIGGCSDGPAIIDFKNKKYWMC